MKRYEIIFVVFILLLPIIPAALGNMVAVPIISDLVLEGNTTEIIEGGEYIMTGGLRLSGNSTLTLINANMTFTKNDEASYTVSGNSKLTIINCSIKWESPRNIQATENAEINLVNVELYSTHQIDNRTYFNTGFGLAGNTEISVADSRIGFIRLTDNAGCKVQDSWIGDFGTQSSQIAEFTGCAIERVFLVYMRSRVQINQTIVGTHELFSQSQLVRAGEVPYDFDLFNTTIMNPPIISVTDGKLEARDTMLNVVYIEGDSAIETWNTGIYYLQLRDYSWAFIEDSNIEYFVAWYGDFNIELENTTHYSVSTYNTVGLNLKTNATSISYLNLDWAQPNTPQNVELHDTTIGDLSLNMYSPQSIQCNKVSLTNLTLESGRGDEPPITITGSIDFTQSAAINQIVKDGYTRIKRIYLIEATINNEPAAGAELTIHLENETKTVTTNQQGQAVIPITYMRHIEVIKNPQPGGPYLINNDNLTKQVTITYNQQNFTLSLISDTPVILAAKSNTEPQQFEPDWTQYKSAAIALAIIAIIIYLINSRRREDE